MIPKAELSSRLETAESKLHRIYKHIPQLEYMEENDHILHSMGYSDAEIHELFSTGSTYKKDSITNPDTGETMLIYLAKTTIEKNPTSGRYEPYINNQQFREFIYGSKLKTEHLERLSKEHSEVREMLQENERLREMISFLSRSNK